MSNAQVWFARRGEVLIATDEESRKVIHRLDDGECQCFKRIAARDPVMHRRYWVLCTLIAKSVRRIEIDRLGGQAVYMPIFTKDNVHTALKLCTGLYETLPVGGSDYAVRVPKSTNFDEMTPDEWILYFPAVMDVIVDKIVPDMQAPESRADVLSSIERWQQEAA